MNKFHIAAVAMLLISGVAAAKTVTYALPDETATLKPGPNQEVAQANCSACHSADYVAIQPPKKGAAFWQAEVTKMRQVYKAQISDEDAKQIVEYLNQTY
jgi:sulfite dehydrogenase (cytochrome) subunit B